MTGEKCRRWNNSDREIHTYTHIRENKSLLRKPITNTMVQGNYVVQGVLVAQPHNLLTNSINQGNSSARDGGLDMSTAPEWGTDPKEAEDNLDVKANRKRMRGNTQEDIALTEVSNISFDHQRNRKIKRENITDGKETKVIINQQALGSFTVANRTLINKILYTKEDAPPMIFTHVLPVLRPNNTTGTLYFQFEIKYFLEVECYYESLLHPQKVPVTYHKCTLDATYENFDYENCLIAPLNRHLHRQIPKGMQHNYSTHIIQQATDSLTGLHYGKFVNK